MSIYGTFFQRKMVQAVVEDAKIKVVVIDIEQEVVVRWVD
jgi:hypothetical protein